MDLAGQSSYNGKMHRTRISYALAALCAVVVSLAALPVGAQGSARYAIRGWVTGLQAGEQAVVHAEGPRNHKQATRPGGRYEIRFLIPGSYRVRVEHHRYDFQPARQRVQVLSTNVTGVNFKAVPSALEPSAPGTEAGVRYRMKGRVADLRRGTRVEIRAQGPEDHTTRTRRRGRWVITGMRPGTYRVAPVSEHHTFQPPARRVSLTSGHVVGITFRAVAGPALAKPRIEPRKPERFRMSGRVQGLRGTHTATITAAGPRTYTATTDIRGAWEIRDMEPGKYRVSLRIHHHAGAYTGADKTKKVLLHEDKTNIDFKLFHWGSGTTRHRRRY